MTVITSTVRNNQYIFGLNQRSARAGSWQLWTVIIPRRTITGRLVRGQVWRRHDGRHWIYKKFVDSATGADCQK
jgi:hypothetical protein